MLMTPEPAAAKQLILCVDDVPTNLHVLSSALRGDYRIKTATSGAAALEIAARDDAPDLILLDVMMPGMSGHDVMAKLRSTPRTSDIPVIFVTADNGSEVEGLEGGAHDFLAKPVNMPVLLTRVRNLLRQRQLQQMVQQSELKLRAMLDSSMQFIGLLDTAGQLLHVNRRVQDLLGRPLGELIGRRFSSLDFWGDAGQRQRVDQAIEHAIAGQASRFETHHLLAGGEAMVLDFSIRPVRDARGVVAYLLPEATDVTQQRRAEEGIRQLANFDALTGLPNRTLLTDRVVQAVHLAQRRNDPLALIFLDLDRFKHINDTLGHDCGDQLLVEVARRLSHALRQQDTVARLGGDEFVLLLPNTDAGGAMVVADKLLGCIAEPCLIDQHELTVTPSIGIAIYPVDGVSYEALSKCADVAIYRAKREGRNTYRFFKPEMHDRSSRALQVESQLRYALERRELTLHYQPQIDLLTGVVVGAEALLRWCHPELGIVSPGEFIPLAEETGMILPIGEWVLRTAALQARRWIDAGLPLELIAVNLSAVQLRQSNLPEIIAGCLRDANLAPQHLELELTESAALGNPEAAIAMLAHLYGEGLKLSIDDFGTGYSSLSYLKRIQIHKLKIDQSFVRDLGKDKDDEVLVEAIISMARSLRLQTVAEGVETTEQLEFLRRFGCKEVQGYLFSRPLPAAEFERWMKARTLELAL